MDMVYEVRRQFGKFLDLWKELVNRNMQKKCVVLLKMRTKNDVACGWFPIVELAGLWGQQSMWQKCLEDIWLGYCQEYFVFKTMPEVLGIMPRNLLKLGL
jgi:hypothetical protein